jgi:hypothetical protein
VVNFYSALGIEDYPFFALVTAGKLGAILMAWKSSKHEAIGPRRYHKCADAFTENISDRAQCQEIRYFVPDTMVAVASESPNDLPIDEDTKSRFGN